jgi:AAA domain
MVARGWLERSRVEHALTDACRANGLFKDDGPNGVRATLASGLRGGMQNPHEDLPDNYADNAELIAEGTKIAQRLIEKEDGLQQDNGQQPEGGAHEAQGGDPLAGFTFHGDAPTEPQPMLVKGLIPRDGIAFIGGQSGAGKTFIACALSVALASGEMFFGRKVAERVGVVILAAEGENTIANRIAVASAQNEAGEILPIAWLGSIPDLSNPVEVKKMVSPLHAVDRKMQAEHGVRLGAVIIDTLAAAFGLKDENDNAEATKALRCMKMLADHTRTVVIPVHHYGKAAETGLRGASAWRAGCDAVLSVLADRDQTTGKCRNRQLALTKSRVGEEGWIVPFDLRFVELGNDEDGESYGACYVEPGESEELDNAVVRLSNVAMAYMSAFQIALIEKGAKVRPFGFEGAEFNAVDREDIRAEFYPAWVADGDDEKKRTAARQKAFKRGEEQAVNKRFIATREVNGKQLVWRVAEQSA